MPDAAAATKLGIIAGGGALPGLLIEACRAQGRPCFVLGLSGMADESALAGDAWVRLGEMGRAFDLLRAAGVAEVVMAGKVRRPSMSDLKPDMKTAAFFARIAGRALGDDGLLRAVITEFEREGFRVVGVDDVLSSLLAPVGVLGRHAPDASAQDDIAVGFAAARAIGAQDVGQAAIAQQGEVLGTEDEAGTDALIVCCGALRRPGPGGVLVKAKKPQQDRRADLPAIGPDTVRHAAKAGLRGIAVEAGGALILDRAAVTALADEMNLFVVGVEPPLHG